MPVDVAAEVVANTLLSSHYNVIALAAPEIGAAVAPGQFVMVKAAPGCEPLLRRPFSVFEILRDAHGVPTGITLLNKNIGVSTSQLYNARPGQHVACLGPLGTPWPVEHVRAACLVAGGVGLAAFATLAEALTRQRIATTMFYGARSADELFYLDFFRQQGIELVLTTEDGSAGERGRVTVALDRWLAARLPPPVVYACGPEAMMAAVAKLGERHGARCLVSMERVMGCGLGGCYSCVVPMRTRGSDFQYVKSCLRGPVLPAEQIVWE
jgi:dihydroorotate dehydrogenase electron transfer subunit